MAGCKGLKSETVPSATGQCTDLMRKRKLKELATPGVVRAAGQDLEMTVVKGVDLKAFDSSYWGSVKIQSTFFLGCSFDSPTSEESLKARGAIILPRFNGLPYDLFRYELYSPEDLTRKTQSGETVDREIYCDYLKKGRFSPDIIEALCRRIHDDAIDDALERLVLSENPVNIVGFMGGSSNKRTDPFYKKTAQLARLLALDGKFVASGGGPGMMEAANLGAYFAAYSEEELNQALKLLGKAENSTDNDWLATAMEVKSKFDKGGKSVGIPTWFYGFEPTNVFATSIAKYFDNSIREGGLVQIGKAGVVFAPGSAGTRQEIFMDAAQNHYGTTGFFSPMVFLGKYQYQVDAPVYPLLQEVATADYKDMLFITDEPDEAVQFIRKHPPARAKEKADRVCGCVPD